MLDPDTAPALPMAPGYGTEAISYVAGLLQHNLVSKEDLWITQAGDTPHDDVIRAMDPSIRQLLWDQEYRNITRVGTQCARHAARTCCIR
jgi:hypothetical protein